jgi:alpha-D-ribose 1-methylphosphonate 5-triphosphate synthase subunit PhnI
LLGEAKIGDFDVSVCVDENVLGFEVAIDDVEAM